MPLSAVDTTIFSNFAHSGYPQALQLMLEGRAITTDKIMAVFLSDDIAARRLAASRGVMVSGTLGVLRGLVQREFITLVEADRLLESMIEHGYRSPVRSFAGLSV